MNNKTKIIIGVVAIVVIVGGFLIYKKQTVEKVLGSIVPVSTFTAITSLSTDDIIPVVDDPLGTPASKKITFANFKTSLSLTSGTVTSVAATVPSIFSISGSPITTSGTLAISYSGTALPVANGGTGVTSLGSVTGTSNQITVTGGSSSIIGSGVTLSLPSFVSVTSLLTVSASSTNATTTNFWITNLATPAGAFLAVNPLGQIIATTTPSGGAGTASDMFSTLTGAEISVIGTTTATISRMHYVATTSNGFTITLPAASSNTGKFLGFRMGTTTALTKLITIAGAGSDLIDGAATRIMWANETATLYSDGANWVKVGGKSIPMQAKMYYTTGTTIAIPDSTLTVTPLNIVSVDNTGRMADTANNRINILRSGQYIINAQVTFAGGASASPGLLAASNNTQTRINKNGSLVANSAVYGPSGGFPAVLSQTVAVATKGDVFTVSAYQSSGSTEYFFVDESLLQLTELPTW